MSFKNYVQLSVIINMGCASIRLLSIALAGGLEDLVGTYDFPRIPHRDDISTLALARRITISLFQRGILLLTTASLKFEIGLDGLALWKCICNRGRIKVRIVNCYKTFRIPEMITCLHNKVKVTFKDIATHVDQLDFERH